KLDLFRAARAQIHYDYVALSLWKSKAYDPAAPPRACALCDHGKSRTAVARGGKPIAHAVHARSRPDHSLRRLPADEAQDPGLRLPRGRLLPDAPGALTRGGADRALD